MKEKIKIEIKNKIESSITNFFEGKKVEVTHILDKIFPQERKIRSLIGGLETSLGTTVWEPITKVLAANNGFEVLDNKKFMMPAEIPDEILNSLSHWEEKRKNRDNEVTLADYVLSLKNKIIELDIKTENMNLKKITAGKGIDLWLRKDNIEYIFDIKTNQINQNGGLSLNRNLMD